MEILKTAALLVLEQDDGGGVTAREPTRLDKFLVEVLTDAMLKSVPLPGCCDGKEMALAAVTAVHHPAGFTVAPCGRCADCGTSVASSRSWTMEELEDAAGQPLDEIENTLLEAEGEGADA